MKRLLILATLFGGFSLLPAHTATAQTGSFSSLDVEFGIEAGYMWLRHGNPRLYFDEGADFETDWQFDAWNGNLALRGALPGAYGAGTTMQDRVVFEAGNALNALYVAGSGDIGFGTSLPQRALHVVDGATPALRLEQDSSGGFGNHVWDLQSGDAGFRLIDVETVSTVPFLVQNGAHDNNLVLAANGNAGFGTASPAAALHLSRNDGLAQALIQETSTTTTPRTLLNLQNNGRPEIVMGNTGSGGEWSFGAGTNFILKQGAVGTASSAKTKLFEIEPTGNATLTGTLTTGGTTCGTGCDRVFAPDYPLPSIAEHAARMTSLGYLPNVGPTPEGAPIDLTDKLGRMLNELEHAHLYIAELEDRTRDLPALRADNATLAARVARLEAALADLTARD